MYDLQTKRKFLKATSTIIKILSSKGYSLDGIKNADAVSIYAMIQFGEAIAPTRKDCDVWMLTKMADSDIEFAPNFLSEKDINSLYRKAVRQIKYYFKVKHIPIAGLDQKQLVRAYAKYKYNESAYDFKEWVLDKIKYNSFKGMPEQFAVKNAKKIRATKRKVEISEPSNRDYKVFLTTNYWKGVRQKVISRDKRCCTKCGRSDKLHVHHKTYANHFKEHEHLEDLITLCDNCHKIEHGIA